MEKINSKLYMENCYMHNGGEREAKEEGRAWAYPVSKGPKNYSDLESRVIHWSKYAFIKPEHRASPLVIIEGLGSYFETIMRKNRLFSKAVCFNLDQLSERAQSTEHKKKQQNLGWNADFEGKFVYSHNLLVTILIGNNAFWLTIGDNWGQQYD
nr:hypothetical protein Iba_chr13fCG5380 [Ipomoea batatas]